ncbi:Post-segregation antitoxin (ccd killing mechanism protein) encoded by the F plasmid [Devosia sp. YR412]|uniref:type II toxin-antitoxin system CcdA family antitoxin n=1 Tax=Devosia sp. YR412 TaxID=1881030 RepID=UPI0008AEAEC1|nr:type II toxin-antitoxin system CcdA family antitoxin [Devosia sp. YR412]SEP76099.1 Post-segregation antitoxin (ccd killing mechanism protein) encoded by the F plasmid [Devosia sp. YR412]
MQKQDKPVIDRAELLRIMDLPLEEFRAARAKRSEAEQQELNRLYQEEFAEAIADYNRHVEEHGLPIEKCRTF